MIRLLYRDITLLYRDVLIAITLAVYRIDSRSLSVSMPPIIARAERSRRDDRLARLRPAPAHAN